MPTGVRFPGRQLTLTNNFKPYCNTEKQHYMWNDYWTQKSIISFIVATIMAVILTISTLWAIQQAVKVPGDATMIIMQCIGILGLITLLATIVKDACDIMDYVHQEEKRNCKTN